MHKEESDRDRTREALTSLISWLTGKRQSSESVNTCVPGPAPPLGPEPQPSEKEVFRSPSLLAGWVDQFILKARPLEEDYKLLPDDQARKSLSITPEQRERCVREYSILRIAGVSAFVKEHYPDDFWLAFSNHIVPRLCQHMYGASGAERAPEIARTLEEYVDATTSKDVDRCSKLYMYRVYDDSDNFYKLTFGGVGYISVEFIASVYEVFRDVHCQVTQGMSYNSLKILTEALESVKAGAS